MKGGVVAWLSLDGVLPVGGGVQLGDHRRVDRGPDLGLATLLLLLAVLQRIFWPPSAVRMLDLVWCPWLILGESLFLDLGLNHGLLQGFSLVVKQGAMKIQSALC